MNRTLANVLLAAGAVTLLVLATRQDRNSGAGKKMSTSRALTVIRPQVVPFRADLSRKRARKGIVAGGAQVISWAQARLSRGLPAVEDNAPDARFADSYHGS